MDRVDESRLPEWHERRGAAPNMGPPKQGRCYDGPVAVQSTAIVQDETSVRLRIAESLIGDPGHRGGPARAQPHHKTATAHKVSACARTNGTRPSHAQHVRARFCVALHTCARGRRGRTKLVGTGIAPLVDVVRARRCVRTAAVGQARPVNTLFEICAAGFVGLFAPTVAPAAPAGAADRPLCLVRRPHKVAAVAEAVLRDEDARERLLSFHKVAQVCVRGANVRAHDPVVDGVARDSERAMFPDGLRVFVRDGHRDDGARNAPRLVKNGVRVVESRAAPHFVQSPAVFLGELLLHQRTQPRRQPLEKTCVVQRRLLLQHGARQHGRVGARRLVGVGAKPCVLRVLGDDWLRHQRWASRVPAVDAPHVFVQVKLVEADVCTRAGSAVATRLCCKYT